MPFIPGPRFDQGIECLPTCTDPGDAPRWEPIIYPERQNPGATPITIRRSGATWLDI